jgi:hypothetical protein
LGENISAVAARLFGSLFVTAADNTDVLKASPADSASGVRLSADSDSYTFAEGYAYVIHFNYGATDQVVIPSGNAPATPPAAVDNDTTGDKQSSGKSSSTTNKVTGSSNGGTGTGNGSTGTGTNGSSTGDNGDSTTSAEEGSPTITEEPSKNIPDKMTPTDNGPGSNDPAGGGTGIVDKVPPVDDGAGASGWALINLILAAIAAALALVALIRVIGARRRTETAISALGIFMLAVSLVVAVAGIVIFIVTEDMSSKMIMTDEWTIWQAVLAVIAVVGSVFARNGRDEKKVSEE